MCFASLAPFSPHLPLPFFSSLPSLVPIFAFLFHLLPPSLHPSPFHILYFQTNINRKSEEFALVQKRKRNFSNSSIRTQRYKKKFVFLPLFHTTCNREEAVLLHCCCGPSFSFFVFPFAFSFFHFFFLIRCFLCFFCTAAVTGRKQGYGLLLLDRCPQGLQDKSVRRLATSLGFFFPPSPCCSPLLHLPLSCLLLLFFLFLSVFSYLSFLPFLSFFQMLTIVPRKKTVTPRRFCPILRRMTEGCTAR